MLTHDQILAALEQEFPRSVPGQPPDGVFLVARLEEPALAMTDPTPYVFIPDVHLVPADDAERFPWVTAREMQVEALARLARLLGRLRQADATLRVWQLGDCIDLWRIGEIGGSVADDVTDTVADRRALIDALCNGAGMQLLAGNHDEELAAFRWPGGPQALKTVILNRGTNAADAVLAHGHQFDSIETLPRRFKEFFARGATEKVPPTPRSMLEAANPHWLPPAPDAPPPTRPGDRNRFLHFALRPDDPLPLSRRQVNVVPYAPVHDPAKAFVDSFGGGGRKPTVDGPRQTFFTDIAWWAEQISKSDGKDVRLVVIGHTHQARIVQGHRPDGTAFVLMDCGAWVGTSFLSDQLDGAMANAQIGVKVGHDLRIYQLGYALRTG